MAYFILAAFVCCATFVQFRGKVRHKRLSLYFNDHSNFLSPVNCLFYAFSKVKHTPYLDTKDFPELKAFQDNWEAIRDEALALRDENILTEASNNDLSTYQSFYKRGWEKFGLTWYGNTFRSAEQMCPVTLSLINSVPSVRMAMFTNLPAGKRLMPHRDPFAGSLRYQLGLQTPCSEDCYLSVDGEKYYWRDGEAVLFDETYLHHVANETDEDRIILLLDVRRPVSFFLVEWIDSLFSSLVMKQATPRNMETDKLGVINKVLKNLYPLRTIGKKIKSTNKTIYYLLQYSIYLALIYMLFLPSF